jgi:LysR family glycine cleavage system transcriptional activator
MQMRARLSLQNLNTFAAAAHALSFQGAAEVLHVTPSAVSHQIRNLESLLGYPLFERLDKRVRLTRRGRQLYLEIREPLRQLHQASRKALHGSEDNALALSVAPVFATRWLLPRLKDFRVCYPEINLSVIATTTLVDFRSEPFDAAIRMGRGDWPDTVSKRLFGRRIVSVCHPDLVERNGGVFEIERMTDQALIHNASMSSLWEEWLSSAGCEVTGALGGIEVQSTAQVLEAVNAGDAIGLVDLSFIGEDLEQGRLVLACEHVLSADEGYFLTYPESMGERTSLQQFAGWMASQVRAG